MADEVTVELSETYEILGEPTRCLSLHKPRVRDLLAMDKGAGDIEKAVLLIASCAAIPRKTVEAFAVQDLMAAQEVLSDSFLSSMAPTSAA